MSSLNTSFAMRRKTRSSAQPAILPAFSLAHGLFGHNDTRHSLPTRMQEAASEGLSPGVRVCFCYQGGVLSGIVTYVGKTATVMVEDRSGAYRDRQGRRYSKYRVPLGHLTVSLEK